MEYTFDTICEFHQNLVRRRMGGVARNIYNRGEHHDESKFEEPEYTGFSQGSQFKGKFGTEEYEEGKRKIKDTLTVHYANNDHHPEHFPDGICGMSLMSLTEMLVDWMCANQTDRKMKGEELIEIMDKKYNLGPQLKSIMKNTIDEIRVIESKDFWGAELYEALHGDNDVKEDES